MARFIHCVSKNVPLLTCYNFDIPNQITIIFGRHVIKKVRNQTMLCFPTSSILCFCTTLQNRKPKIASFHLNTVCCFANEHTKYIQIITWSLLNYSFRSQSDRLHASDNYNLPGKGA